MKTEILRYRVNEAKRDSAIEYGRNLWDKATAYGFCAYLNRVYIGQKYYVQTVICIELENGTLAAKADNRKAANAEKGLK